MIFNGARRFAASLANAPARVIHIRRLALATVGAFSLLFSVSPAAATSRDITIHETTGISWHAKLWVLLYCRKGYKAVHGGYGKVPTGLRILSSGPETVNDGSYHTVIWAINAKNTTSRWLELRTWATCSR